MPTTCNRKVTDCPTRSHLDLAGSATATASGQSSRSRLSDMEDFLDLASQLSKLAQLSQLAAVKTITFFAKQITSGSSHRMTMTLDKEYTLLLLINPQGS